MSVLSGAWGHGHAHGPHGHAHSGDAFHSHDALDTAFRTDPDLAPPAPLGPGAGRGQVLFFDCSSGISGDMILAALCDLGVPSSIFAGVISALGLEGEASLSTMRGRAGAISATRVEVTVGSEPPERPYASIRALIEGSDLAPGVKQGALAVFERLALAEAEVHGVPVADVTFHEVGATDSIVDVVGAVAGLDYLGAELVVSPLPLGRGFVDTRHGRLPLPAPATLLCLRGVPTTPDPLEVELVTPTGAAIVGTLAARFVGWPALTPRHVGWGAGARTLPDRPNALRALLGSPPALTAAEEQVAAPRLGDSRADRVLLLEANVDDMTGEVLSHALARLLDAGALDAWIVPITMKKGRPAFILTALAPRERVSEIERAYFDETTTLGVRRRELDRTLLDRQTFEVHTRFGVVPIKQGGSPPHHYKPEFDACVAIAEKYDVPVRLVIEEALVQARSRR